MAALPRPSCFIAGFAEPSEPSSSLGFGHLQMLQVLLSLKNSHLSAYKNCYDDINGSKVNLKD